MGVAGYACKGKGADHARVHNGRQKCRALLAGKKGEELETISRKEACRKTVKSPLSAGKEIKTTMLCFFEGGDVVLSCRIKTP